MILRYAFLFVLSMTSAAAAEVRVVDGDTLKLPDGQNHRIFGIDAPEHGQKCKSTDGSVWPCGKAATQAMVDLVSGKEVVCSTRFFDDFGRPVSTCFVGDMDIGAEMVRQGHAWAFVKYETPYVPDELIAKGQALGIWRAPTQTPWDYRAERWKVAEQAVPDNVDPNCRIKGNISNNGHIYHAPWSPYYTRTKITTAKGERWFCSEEEAIKAGWRAPYWGQMPPK